MHTAEADRPLSCAVPPVSSSSPDEYVRPLVRDLHKVKRSIYWADFLGSSLTGWLCFAIAAKPGLSASLTVASLLACVACLYRSLCFVHELSHQTHRTLPGFEACYNALIGFPLLMPSFVYVGVHQSHHRVDIYGTENDPEYLPFSRSWLMTTVFAMESVLIPVLLFVRFVLLTPAAIVSPRFAKWLAIYLSSLTMNPKYRRNATPQLVAKIRHEGAVIVAIWASAIGLSIAGILPWRWLAIWFAVDASISLINTLRTLGAHAYESDGAPMDREAQLRDSIDTPGAFWTELWAPVGLRYHALHHYFPGIPYHNLPEAYRRVVGCLPIADEYCRMSSRSLPHSLGRLLGRGWSQK